MEAAGLAVGVVGLAGLFTTVVDCFEYVHFARNFVRDYETSQLLLEDTQLRLCRWGETVNIHDETKLKQTLGTQERFSQVNRRLKQLKRLFDELNDKTNEFTSNPGNQLILCNPNTGIKGVSAKARNSLRKLYHRSHDEEPRALKKAKWALHTKEEFNNLRSDANEIINGLEERFPEKDFREKLQAQVIWEAEEIDDGESQKAILEAITIGEGNQATPQDPLLTVAIAKAIEAREGHLYEGNQAVERAKAVYGDYISDKYKGPLAGKSSIYKNNTAGGDAKVLFGNQYGGRSPFDD